MFVFKGRWFGWEIIGGYFSSYDMIIIDFFIWFDFYYLDGLGVGDYISYN